MDWVVGVRDGDEFALYGHFGWFCTVASQSVPYGCHGQFRTGMVSFVQLSQLSPYGE